MEKIQFIWSGEAELPTGWTLQQHSHDFFHLAYVQKGQLIFRADGLDYPLSESSLILLPPGVVHGVPKDTHNLCVQYEILFRIPDTQLQKLPDTKKSPCAARGSASGAPLLLYLQPLQKH